MGIVLITVSGIAWRLTASDAPSCRAMLGLSGYEEDYNNGRFLSRPQVTNNTSYGGATRPQHPYAGTYILINFSVKITNQHFLKKELFLMVIRFGISSAVQS